MKPGRWSVDGEWEVMKADVGMEERRRFHTAVVVDVVMVGGVSEASGGGDGMDASVEAEADGGGQRGPD